jgi:hypothetical protein
MSGLFTRITRVVLSVSLALYAHGAMAGSHPTGPTFSMVICSDGVGKTVEVDLDGKPVDPSDECCACLDCGMATVAAPPPATGSRSPRTFSPLTPGEIRQESRRSPEPFSRPMPRAPPVAADGPKVAPEFKACMTAQTETAPESDPKGVKRPDLRHGGRPFKEAAT